jgi:hypothetical protein
MQRIASSKTPARVFHCIHTHNFFRWFCVRLITRPADSCSAKIRRAAQQGAIRKIRRLGNRHQVEPILDAPREGRRGSAVEAQSKSGSHRPSKECSFSRCETSALIRLRLFRVRRIFEYHSRGAPHSLFRDRKCAIACRRAPAWLLPGQKRLTSDDGSPITRSAFFSVPHIAKFLLRCAGAMDRAFS